MPEQTDPVREADHLAGVIHEQLTEPNWSTAA